MIVTLDTELVYNYKNDKIEIATYFNKVCFICFTLGTILNLNYYDISKQWDKIEEWLNDSRR